MINMKLKDVITLKRNIIYLICCFLFLVDIQIQKVLTEEIEITSPSAILIDAESGQILYEKNAYEQRYPASITKIMTTYLAITYGDLNESLTVSKEAVDSIGKNASNMALQVGEILNFKDAVYGAYLISANDACNVLAEAISGSTDNFVDLMNETAHLAGANHTHFSNTNGLPDENHVTTAYDMAMITKYAMKSEKWMELFTTESYTMPATNLSSERTFIIGNEMALSTSDNYYPNVLGGKTGWTPDAKLTLVTVCRQNNRILIAVIMGCEDIQKRYNDTRTLFDYGFKMVQNTYSANDFIFPHTELTKENEVIAIASFTLNEDISFLYPTSIPFEDLTINLTIKNPNNPQLISASLNLTFQDSLLYTTDVQIELSDPPQSNSSFLSDSLLIVSLSLFVCFLFIFLLNKTSKNKHNNSNN